MKIFLFARSYNYTRNGTGAILLTKVVLGKVRNVAAWNEVMTCPPGFNSVRIYQALVPGYTNIFLLMTRLSLTDRTERSMKLLYILMMLLDLFFCSSSNPFVLDNQKCESCNTVDE